MIYICERDVAECGLIWFEIDKFVLAYPFSRSSTVEALMDQISRRLPCYSGVWVRFLSGAAWCFPCRFACGYIRACESWLLMLSIFCFFVLLCSKCILYPLH